MKKWIMCALAGLGIGLFAQSSVQAQGFSWGFSYSNGHSGFYGNNWNRGVYGRPGCDFNHGFNNGFNNSWNRGGFNYRPAYGPGIYHRHPGFYRGW